MQVQSVEYFRSQYGNRALTVMHRMRTWYSQKAKASSKRGDLHEALRYDDLAMDMTDRIGMYNGRNRKAA